MLVLRYLQLKSTFGWSLSNLVAMLRLQLFVYRDLHTWLDCPFEAPPALDGIHNAQLVLNLARSEEHTSELQSQSNLVCRLLLEKKKKRRDLESQPLAR